MTQRYLNGEFHRSFGSDYLSSPSGFVQWGEILVAVELFERLAALDGNDNLIGYIGDNASAQARPGWPNTLAEDGRAEALNFGSAEVLNCRHSTAVDAAGNLYVSEWIIGGRYSRGGVQVELPNRRRRPSRRCQRKNGQ